MLRNVPAEAPRFRSLIVVRRLLITLTMVPAMLEIFRTVRCLDPVFASGARPTVRMWQSGSGMIGEPLQNPPEGR